MSYLFEETRIVPPLPPLLSLLTVMVFGIASLGSAQDEGKELFVKAKCNTCHSVESQGIEVTRESSSNKAPDMSDAGNLISDAEWAKQYVMREAELEGKKHRRPYKGSDQDLTKIVDWLMTLKKS